MFVVLITQSFHVGIRAAAPVVAAVLLATLVLGLISRTLPQLNVMVVGFGLNAMITFAVFSLPRGRDARLPGPDRADAGSAIPNVEDPTAHP